PLAGDDLRHRVELEPQAVPAQLLPRLDERARDVAVLDEAVVVRDRAGARVAARGRVARVGYGDYEVGVDRRLAREDLAHPPARALQGRAAHDRVGPREVDVLEDAERAACAFNRDARRDAAAVDREHLARLDLAQEARADDVERARLARDAVAVAEHPERER